MSGSVIVAPSGSTVRSEEAVAKVLAMSAGPAGRSAYKVAVDAGFVGTEAQWLATLTGAQGQSAYDLAVEAGFEGTEAEWRASLQGATGPLPTPFPKVIADREYTLTAADLWKTLIFTSAYSVTVWVPEGLPYFTCTIVRNGAGTVSVRPALGSAVVVNAPGDKLALGARYESAMLWTVGTDAYVLKGADIAAPAYNYPITGLTLTKDTVVGGSPIGTYVGQLLPADIDSGETFTFEYLGGDGKFTIDAAGKVFTGATKTANTGTAPLSVRVTDSDHHTFDQVFTITLEPFYGEGNQDDFVVDWRLKRFWDPVRQAEASFSDWFDFSRPTPGWAPDSAGVEHAFAANEPRITDLGIITEEAVTNLYPFPDAPATRTVAGLTAGHYVLWITGPGSVTVSGTFTLVEGSNPVVAGTAMRFSLASTQSITFTVAGAPTFAQVRKLATTTQTTLLATAVHGAGATNTRAVDVLTIKGALRDAMATYPNTPIFELIENPVRVNFNRRLYRGGGGTQLLTAIINSQGKLNASNQLSTGPTVNAYNWTTGKPIPLGALVRLFICQAAGNNGGGFQSAADAEAITLSPTDPNGAPNASSIATITAGSRNDTNAEAFNGFQTRWIVRRRRVLNSEIVAPDTSDVPRPAYVEYAPIVATGGAGGALHTLATLGQAASKLQLTTPRTVKITAAGREPYSNTVTVKSGAVTIRGNAAWYAFAGGGMVVGDDNHLPDNVIIEDVHFAPGNEDVGRNFDDRDGLGVWAVRNMIIRNCSFIYATDEGLSLYKSLASPRILQNILVEYSDFGPNLYAPVDGNGVYRKSEVPHNMGLLAADGLENVCIRFNRFVGNSQRNPVFGVGKGLLAYNNLVYDWMQYGLMIFEQISQYEVRGATVAYLNNLLKRGPNTSDAARAMAQVILRTGPGNWFCYKNNAITDGVNFANDVILNGLSDVARVSGADPRSLSDEMSFGMSYVPLTDHAAIWAEVMNKSGVRLRDGNDAIIQGDIGASPVTLAISNAIRNGTSLKISDPSQWIGFP